MLNNDNVIQLIAGVLEKPIGQITMETTNETVDNWDSLTHLNILERLDRATQGKSTRIPELATAFSVIDIVKLLKLNGLYADSAH